MITESNKTASSRVTILRELCQDYKELNGTYIESIDMPPSSIEFLRYTRISRPLIIHGMRISALDKWNDDYLCAVMNDEVISVAVTPDGHADAIATANDGKRYFSEPHVEKSTMQQLLRSLSPSRINDFQTKEVHYLQSQNGNLYCSTPEIDEECEFAPLRKDVPRDVSWATEAFGLSPDAVNIWIGNEQSVTSVHSDPYENIYTVVRGAKHFTLFPPTEGWCLQECMYPHARYIREASGALKLVPSGSSHPPVRWSSIQNPDDEAELPSEASPITVTVRAGETLYLPAGWWHYVRQSGLTIALNWWYDMEVRGMNWVWMNFLRGPGDDVPDGNGNHAG